MSIVTIYRHIDTLFTPREINNSTVGNKGDLSITPIFVLKSLSLFIKLLPLQVILGLIQFVLQLLS